MATPTELPTEISEDTEKEEILDRLTESFKYKGYITGHTLERTTTQDAAMILELPRTKVITNNPSGKNLEEVERNCMLIGVFDGVSQRNGLEAASIINNVTKSIPGKVAFIDQDPTRDNNIKEKDIVRNPKYWLKEINEELNKEGRKLQEKIENGESNNPSGIMAAGSIASIERNRRGTSDISIAIVGDITPILHIPDEGTYNIADKGARLEGSDHILKKALGNNEKLKYKGSDPNAHYTKIENVPAGSILFMMTDGISDVLERVIINNKATMEGVTTVHEFIEKIIKKMKDKPVEEITKTIFDLVNKTISKYPNQYKDDDKVLTAIKM